MKKSLALTGTVLAACAALCLAQNREAQQQAADSNQVSQNLDQGFVKHEALSNQFEIQLAQLVSQRTQDEQVKRLAQQIIEDHQRAQQELQRAAQAVQIQMPTELDQIHQLKLQEWQQKQGKMLEAAYTFDMVGDHQKDILMHRYVAQNAQNEQVKQYAQQSLQPLEQHERLAWQAAEQFVPQARTASERIRGTGEAGQTETPGSTGTSGSNTTGGRTTR